MDRSGLITGVIGAWVFGLGFDFIERMTGTRVHLLLIAAIVSLAVGLCVGLNTNKGNSQMGEA